MKLRVMKEYLPIKLGPKTCYYHQLLAIGVGKNTSGVLTLLAAQHNRLAKAAQRSGAAFASPSSCAF